MKVTICGSTMFVDEMQRIKLMLEGLGHLVETPPLHVENGENSMISVQDYYEIRKNATADDAWVWDTKEDAIRAHFNKVLWSDAILVLNYSKRDIENYIGANTLLEMGLAFHFRKPIFLLNGIPELSYKEEILGMKPFVIYGDLSLIKDVPQTLLRSSY